MSNIRRARPYAREEAAEKRWRTQAVFYADPPYRPHRYRNECRVGLLKWRTEQLKPVQVDLFEEAA